jgi:predicted TIM-barrel fold metal-dependent hydrolase
MSTQQAKIKVIDSHLHVWASSTEAATRFPYSQDPPDSLKDAASTDQLVATMNAHGVHGALIVQPINHKFDHSYVLSAMKTYPDRFKGMLLYDPSLTDEQEAVSRLEDLALQGFVGVRFNPYLWPKTSAEDDSSSWSRMSQGAGLAVYKRCAQLNMPVGIMCFQGLQLHYDDILQLLNASPKTVMILDHLGFTSIINDNDNNDDTVFQKLLLDLAKYPQVMVKVSALFRLKDTSPYERVRKERFLPLLQAFGADRLMYGSDFPFVLEQPPEKYGGMLELVSSWIDNGQDKRMIMGGTAEKAFGPWGVGATVS